MTSVEIILGLLLAAILIALVAKQLDLPYSIALVLGGVGLASIPGIPRVAMDPNMVFYLLLPPILTEAAFFTSWRDLVRYKRPILLLALGLVTATSTFVAVLCVLFIPGMTWSTGFLLGAIVSPPDASAATSITRGLGLPKRVVQILEGESLVNDASGLTLYRFAIMVIAGSGFTWGDASLSFLWIVTGGVMVGWLLGFGLVKVYHYLRDPEVEVLATFLLSYMSYFVAEQVHASGVLATVVSGLILGWKAPEIFTANSRIRGFAVWQTAVFFTNASIFLLIGLQIPGVLKDLAGYPPIMLAWWCLIITLGVMAIRLVWVFPAAYMPHVLFASVRAAEPFPDWRAVFIVGWTGLRGVVSLAAALALPLETERGLPFPYRNLILLLTLAVIVGTLLLQGLPLRPLVRWLKLPLDRSSEEEQLQARIHATEVVLDKVLEWKESGLCTGPALERIRGYYEDRLAELRSRLEIETGSGELESPQNFQSINEQKLWWKLVKIERAAILEMRKESKIGDEALHEIERDIDLLEARITPRKTR